MTDRDIHDAFMRMEPDEDAKKRMLENILSAASETPPEKRRKRHGWKGSLLLAAAAAAGLSVMAAAYGSSFFGLWSVGLRDQEIYSPVEVEPGVFLPGTQVVDEVSLQGLTGSPEYQASADWENFLAGYDADGAILAAADSNPVFLPPDYDAYSCYSQEMADQLDALCETYGLALLGPSRDAFTIDELSSGAGTGNVCGGSTEKGENLFYWGYYYDGGTCFYEGAFQWADGRITDYQFNCAAKGYLGTAMLNVGKLDDYEQWEYTSESGVPLLLALGPSKGLVIADTEGAFVVINVLGEWPVSFDLNREDMEDFADAFDLSAIL